jgi:hypothetical protein
MIISRPVLLRMRTVSDKFVEKIIQRILCSITFFNWKSCSLWDDVQNIVEGDRLMWMACWTPKATSTHSEYVILIFFPRASKLRYGTLPVLFPSMMSPIRLSNRNVVCSLWGTSESCITCQLIVVHSLTTLYCPFQFPIQCRLSIRMNQFSRFEHKL